MWVVNFNASGPDAAAGAPPFRALIGECLRLSGVLRGISRGAARLGVRWQAPEVVVARPGIQAVVQRPGEARVLVDGFETLDKSRWATSGDPSLAEEPRLSEGKSLRLPAGGSSLLHGLEEPLGAGRFDVAFLDSGTVAAGQQWFVELSFRGTSGLAAVRVALGWSEETLAVECPKGPSLAIQRLARTPGWHRLSLRFGPEQTEISVDGKELAHGKGPDGPLVSIQLGSSNSTGRSTPKGLAGYLDDLQLTRLSEPTAGHEVDITQDEARLVTGDELYGEIQQAGADRVLMTVDGKVVSLPWSEVSGLYFRRTPAAGATIDGLLVRLEWRSAPGGDPADIDFAEGALHALSDEVIKVATPYAGVLGIPRGLVHKLTVLGQGRRLVIDPAAHHLGDEVSVTPPFHDPIEPEGASLERSIALDQVPDRPAYLVLDVTQVEGEDNDSKFSANVRRGELRTYVVVNGRRIDYINRYIKTQGEATERISIPIPAGLLHPGQNTFRLELTGLAGKDVGLDDFGVRQIALEFVSGSKPAPPPPAPPLFP
jgi:hypothetical protein